MHRFDRPGDPGPVLWTRGAGCGELAALLSGTEPVRVKGDVAEACVEHRASLLVTRRLPNLDLVDVAVPVDFEPGRVEAVVATVGGGPHSPLAARVAKRLGSALGVDALMACAYRDDEGRDAAISLIERLYREVPGIEYRAVEADGAAALVSELPESALLVLGAPGGNWFQRTLFGQGARLRARAPVGAVIVRASEPKAFQMMGEPVFVGPLREAHDILRIHEESVLAVVDHGHLVGLVRKDTLRTADPRTSVADLMEDPRSIPLEATVDDAVAVAVHFDGAPIPVVDGEGRLVGGLSVPH